MKVARSVAPQIIGRASAAVEPAHRPPAVKHHVIPMFDQNQVAWIIIGMVAVDMVDVEAIPQALL